MAPSAFASSSIRIPTFQSPAVKRTTTTNPSLSRTAEKRARIKGPPQAWHGFASTLGPAPSLTGLARVNAKAETSRTPSRKARYSSPATTRSGRASSAGPVPRPDGVSARTRAVVPVESAEEQQVEDVYEEAVIQAVEKKGKGKTPVVSRRKSIREVEPQVEGIQEAEEEQQVEEEVVEEVVRVEKRGKGKTPVVSRRKSVKAVEVVVEAPKQNVVKRKSEAARVENASPDLPSVPKVKLKRKPVEPPIAGPAPKEKKAKQASPVPVVVAKVKSKREAPPPPQPKAQKARPISPIRSPSSALSEVPTPSDDVSDVEASNDDPDDSRRKTHTRIYSERLRGDNGRLHALDVTYDRVTGVLHSKIGANNSKTSRALRRYLDLVQVSLLNRSDQMASLNAASQEVNLARSSAKQLRLDLLAVQRSRILTQGRIRAQEKGWREGRAKVETVRSLHGYLSELSALSMDWNEGAPTMSEDRPKASAMTRLEELRAVLGDGTSSLEARLSRFNNRLRPSLL